MNSANPASGRFIIVGFYGSPQSDAALRWVLGVAAQPDDSMHAVLVRPTESLLSETSFALQRRGRHPAGVYAPHDDIARIRAEFPSAADVTISTPRGDPATELIAASTDADLLVVGAHGAGRTRELLLRSVSCDFVRYSRCPVVVVTPGAARRLVPAASPWPLRRSRLKTTAQSTESARRGQGANRA
ncbi:universal stress protein [Amycolatopsis sp. DSM 110486]|uniref:universal stress protein n=1 Tax=Amycolatopsis sp. DSM 110486 TaxID=2865832 RepID=UPI001C69AB52|nr:universal stress protein [Amycolatopsis sp. DSM 110486]QYN18667.1 universal stress protein [Amycolatopsis sp. DSM 110486]